eukprot:3492899-Rhodomonas_salina.2
MARCDRARDTKPRTSQRSENFRTGQWYIIHPEAHISVAPRPAHQTRIASLTPPSKLRLTIDRVKSWLKRNLN